MIGDRFQRVAELFEAARARDAPGREAFLRKMRGDGDGDDMIAEVRALLAHHDDDEAPLGAPLAPGVIVPDCDAAEGDVTLPTFIGRYQVKRSLGIGGMGLVYLAEQDHPRRQVAVKVIRPGLVTRELLQRFERETELLGRLQHPGIAQIHEAGMDDDGSGARPYFAMEYVAGAPLLEHARDRGLGVRARLELFTRVCDAVAHAHQRGIIHRDLKPGNILVDDAGQPKILDFGVARATESDMQVSTLHTDAGRLMGTVAYMSPEQVCGRASEIDTRSDIYALGVLLYELLAGQLPYDLEDRTIAGAARVISEQEPIPLGAIDRRLRGDLDTIVRTALAKDPERRYQSAAALRADVRRFLDNEPIAARPATTMYQLRKLARRHRGPVAGLIVAFLAIGAGAVAATVGMVRARDEAAQARAMSAFLERVLTAADSTRSGDVRLIDLLRDAAKRAESEFAGHPELAARMHELLSRAFGNILYDQESEHHARRWLEAVESVHGAGHPATRRARLALGGALHTRMKLDEAETILRGIVTEDGEDDTVAIGARIALGSLFTTRGAYAEAEDLLRGALPDAEEALGQHHHVTVRARMKLGQVLDNRGLHGGDPPEVRASLRAEAADMFRQLIEDESRTDVLLLDGLQARMRLSDYARAMRRYDEGAAWARDGMAVVEARLGPEHPYMGRFEKRLARALFGLGQHEEAAAHAIQAVIRSRDTERDAIQAIIDMGTALPILDAAGEWETALEYARHLAQRLGREHGFGLEARIWLPYLHTRLGHPEEAPPLLEEVTSLESTMDDRNRARLHYATGFWCAAEGRAEDAREHLTLALELCDDEPSLWPTREGINEALAGVR